MVGRVQVKSAKNMPCMKESEGHVSRQAGLY